MRTVNRKALMRGRKFADKGRPLVPRQIETPAGVAAMLAKVAIVAVRLWATAGFKHSRDRLPLAMLSLTSVVKTWSSK